MKKEIPNPLVRRIFELKVLAFDGEAMAAFSCANCGKEKVIAFYTAANGMLCEECVKKAGFPAFFVEFSLIVVNKRQRVLTAYARGMWYNRKNCGN